MPNEALNKQPCQSPSTGRCSFSIFIVFGSLQLQVQLLSWLISIHQKIHRQFYLCFSCEGYKQDCIGVQVHV